MEDHGRLVGVGLVDGAGRPGIDQDLVYFAGCERRLSERQQIPRLPLSQAVVKENPSFAVDEDARIAREALVPTAFGTDRNNGVLLIPRPRSQVAGRCDSGLLNPAAALFARTDLRLCVVEKIERPTLLHKARLVEPARFPV